MSKMISCSLCDFQAFSKGNLSFHLNNVHFKDKEFMCRLCHFKTAYKGALTRHVNSVHLRTGKTKECPICGYVTASLLNLNSHLSVSHHLEIATAFARPSNHNNNNSPHGGTEQNPDDPSPPLLAAPPTPAHPAPPVSPGPSGPDCRICPFRARDQAELLVHYNLAHLNSAQAVLSRDRGVGAPSASGVGDLPIGDEEAAAVIRQPMHPDDLLELRRRQHEELARRQEILERIEHSRRHLSRHEELVAQINSARILHHQQSQLQAQHQLHLQQQQLGPTRRSRSRSRSPPPQQHLYHHKTPPVSPPRSPVRHRHHHQGPPSPPTHHRRCSSPPPQPSNMIHRVEPHSPPPHHPPSPVIPRSHHGGPVFDEDRANALQCRLCPFQASSFIYLKNHIRTAHLQEVHTLACPLCEYTSDSRNDLENHIDDDHAALNQASRDARDRAAAHRASSDSLSSVREPSPVSGQRRSMLMME